MTIWTFLHIAAMFGAVSIFVGQGILSAAVAGSGDVRAMRRVLAAEDRFSPVGGALMGLGVVFGFVTALTGDLDLTAPWLLIGYGLVVVIFATGIVYHRPRDRKLRALADASPENEPSDELWAVIRQPSARVVSTVDALVWLAVIFDMVAKPFS